MNTKSWILSSVLLVSLVTPGANAESVNPKILHLVNRISFGASPGELERVRSIGVDRYLQEQLHPETIPESQTLSNQLSQLETLQLSPMERLQQYSKAQNQASPLTPEQLQANRKTANLILQQAAQARILRDVETPRQLEAVITDFWFNHFNVYANKGRDRVLVGSYEDAIRPHVFGRFRELLEATARHPAMLFYLDNWQNTAPDSPGAKGRFQGLNENYARELMELHTLGVDGGYTQQDVTTLARILTGWGLSRLNQKNADSSGFYFDPKRHDFSDKVFLGQSIKGSGEAEVEQALDILAKSPATAHHISYQLAQYFVADRPPTSLVNRLTQRYLDTDGDIRSLLDTLFHSDEFWQASTYNSKFKTPYEYVISALRATGTKVENPRSINSALQPLGMPIYGCPTPDGYKNTQDAWLNPDAMTRRLSFATTIASGRLDRSQSTEAINPDQLTQTLGISFSEQTATAIATNPRSLRSALILGSPEFMHH